MSQIVVRGHHDLGLARARRLAEVIALQLRDDYGVTYAWTGDQLQFEQVGIRGIFSDWAATVTYYANCMGLK